MGELKIWTNTGFTGHYPVGVAAVIIATDAKHATKLLNEHLKSIGLPGDAKESGMRAIIATDARVIILNNGDY